MTYRATQEVMHRGRVGPVPKVARGRIGSGSFPCPGCGGVTVVTDSRGVAGGIKRRRQCMNTECLIRTTTYEHAASVAGARDTLAELLERAREMVRLLEERYQA